MRLDHPPLVPFRTKFSVTLYSLVRSTFECSVPATSGVTISVFVKVYSKPWLEQDSNPAIFPVLEYITEFCSPNRCWQFTPGWEGSSSIVFTSKVASHESSCTNAYW